ncbi:hypothetical protein NC651_020181 [Populus alba x Populus x berolinensis]|nr:hypothetical protein NC651_020181 [Populus alba x Populus x berolinensis]
MIWWRYWHLEKFSVVVYSISKEAGDRIKVIDSTLPWYVKGCSSLGLFCGLYSRLRFPFQEPKW